MGRAQAQPKPPVPSQAVTDEAKARFKRGLELFTEGDAATALIEFRKAYSLQPRYQVLYNIGKVYMQLNEYAEALAALEKYLAEGGTDIAGSRRTEVERDVENLRARVATLEITSTPPDGTITIDDTRIDGKTPLTLRVSAGKRRVTVNKDGFFPVTLNVEIAGLETKKVTFDLVDARPKAVTQAPDPTPPPQKVPEPPPQPLPPPPSKVSAGAVIGWVGTGLFLGGTVAMGTVALSTKGKRDELIGKLNSSASDIKAQNDKAVTFAILTDVLGASTAVLGGISIYLTARSPSKPASALWISPQKIGWTTSF
jgi:hypothetical protein